MAKTPKHTKPEVSETATETPSQPPQMINFAEPLAPADLTAGVSDKADEPLLTAADLKALHAQAHRDDEKRDFTLKVLEARAPVNTEPVEMPVIADRILEQTRLEMEAGRKMNDHHASLAVHRPPPAPDKGTTAVFRPEDYVPDQKKGQGNIVARNL